MVRMFFNGLSSDKNESETKQSLKIIQLSIALVLLLIIINSTTILGKEPVNNNLIGSDRIIETELIACANHGEAVSSAHQANNSKSNYPLGLKKLSFKKIFAQFPIITADGEKATLVYVGPREVDASDDLLGELFPELSDDNRKMKPNKDRVNFIYYIPQYHNMPTDAVYLPEVKAFVYHDLEKDKEFASIVVKFPEYKNGKCVSYVKKEIKLTDDDAIEIIDFLDGDKQYKNHIFNFKIEETKNEELRKPERTDY